jgi:3-oxoacyl-[acyl-carrier protein] reductase
MNLDLKDKVALVTGASRGLGAVIACALAASGAKVAINYLRRHDQAQAVRQEIEARGGMARLFPGDVTDEEQVAQMHQQVVGQLGSIDILVINATLPHVHKPIESLSWQDMLDHMQFFVKSPLLLAQQVLPAMKKQGYGRIIHIGSEVFETGPPQCCNYVAAKGAQLGLTRAWAKELGSFQITVNLVAPGWIPTEMHAHVPQSEKQTYARHVPLQRMGSPEDVAQTVVFLASRQAGFITGQRLTVNGGNTFS